VLVAAPARRWLRRWLTATAAGLLASLPVCPRLGLCALVAPAAATAGLARTFIVPWWLGCLVAAAAPTTALAAFAAAILLGLGPGAGALAGLCVVLRGAPATICREIRR